MIRRWFEWIQGHLIPIGGCLVVLFSVLALIGYASATWPKVAAVKPMPNKTTEITSPPKDDWTKWNELFEPALVKKYNLRFVDVYDKADWWKVLYVTEDNRKCDARFFSYANEPWLEQTTNCVNLI